MTTNEHSVGLPIDDPHARLSNVQNAAVQLEADLREKVWINDSLEGGSI
jgi:hypothetical protein